VYTLDNRPPHGLVQQSGFKDTLTTLHDSETGWPIKFFKVPCSILLQDDLTYKNGVILELEKYKEHYGNDIDQVTFYTEHRNLKNLYPTLNLVYFPWFLYDHLVDTKKWHVDEMFEFNDTHEFVFMCLNRNLRAHRDKALSILQNFPSRLLSYQARNWQLYGHDDWNMDYYRDFELGRSGEDIKTNTANLIQLKSVYNKCQFSVVAETRYDLPFDFYTEKTTQCFLALHPALYVSNKGHVKLLREYGFDMFDDVFDNSYDDMSDDVRLNYMIESNREVLTNGIPDFHKLKNRLIANRNHFLDTTSPIFKCV